MHQLLTIYKSQGLTPLQTIHLLREKFPEYKNSKIGFAGRLDPLAHGVLLLMIGEETTKKKDKYLDLPKEYEFEAVLGVATDTYDALGMISHKVKSYKVIKKALDNIQLDNLITQFIQSKLGKQIQSYPPYSSKTVNGKPLYQWAREGKLSEIEIPTREIEIYDFKLIKTNTITVGKLQKEIFKQIESVTGDFRQEEIKKSWKILFANCQPLTSKLQTARFIISCSSGTYVRSIVHELGEKLGTGAITLDILRTKVGKYTLSDTIKLA